MLYCYHKEICVVGENPTRMGEIYEITAYKAFGAPFGRSYDSACGVLRHG
jgi:hypothetical protein